MSDQGSNSDVAMLSLRVRSTPHTDIDQLIDYVELKDMLKIVSKARARHEGLKLPAGDEILLLPEPTEQ